MGSRSTVSSLETEILTPLKFCSVEILCFTFLTLLAQVVKLFCLMERKISGGFHMIVDIVSEALACLCQGPGCRSQVVLWL